MCVSTNGLSDVMCTLSLTEGWEKRERFRAHAPQVRGDLGASDGPRHQSSATQCHDARGIAANVGATHLVISLLYFSSEPRVICLRARRN